MCTDGNVFGRTEGLGTAACCGIGAAADTIRCGRTGIVEEHASGVIELRIIEVFKPLEVAFQAQYPARPSRTDQSPKALVPDFHGVLRTQPIQDVCGCEQGGW